MDFKENAMSTVVQLGQFLTIKFRLSIITISVDLSKILYDLNKIGHNLKLVNRGWKMPFTMCLSHAPSRVQDCLRMVTFSKSRSKMKYKCTATCDCGKEFIQKFKLEDIFSRNGNYIKNFDLTCDTCLFIYVNLKNEFTKEEIQNYYRK